MIPATQQDKPRVVAILIEAFGKNKSVNYLLPQDAKRERRLQHFMAYAFDLCFSFGQVFLSADGKACALVLFPDKKKTTFRSLCLTARFVFCAIGISNVGKALRRESKIQRQQPKGLLYYLWFIGVEAREQGKGIGSRLLTEVIREGEAQNRLICLETSTPENLPWYQKFGFTVYRELDFGYTLFCLKRPA